MTAPNPGVDDVRRLLAEARAIVDAIDAISASAGDAAAREFGAYLSRLAHRHWDDLLGAVRRADADMFDRLLQPLVALTVPLDDAPPSAKPAADVVGERMDVLARDLRRSFEAQLTADNELPQPVLASVATALREVGPEFG
jgi:hypothetical protein